MGNSALSVFFFFFAMLFVTGASQATDLRIGIADDPDALDAKSNRTNSGVAVLTAMCDRLLWTDSGSLIQPGLAKTWSWSENGRKLTLDLIEGGTFQDGTRFDAASVKLNLDRYREPGSQRADDISSIRDVEVDGDHRVVIRLGEPSAQLLSKLAERAGIMFSPAAISALGDDLGRAPICIGPYKFQNRVAQDSIILQRDNHYYDASAYKFDRVIFRVIPDGLVRLANLRSGSIDLMEKLEPSLMPAAASDKHLRIFNVPSLNNQGLVINLKHPGPLQNPKVREALDLALDRKILVKVAFADEYEAGNQFIPPSSLYYNPSIGLRPRDVTKAKSLLAESGFKTPVPFTLLVPNRPSAVNVAQIIQSMAADVGFAVKLNVADFVTTLNLTDAGDFESWGPIGPQFANDPDTLAFSVLHSSGGRNLARYNNPEMDKILEATRLEVDTNRRVDLFRQASALAAHDRPVIYLYHQPAIFAGRADLQGFHATGEALPRLDHVEIK
jgi:peptide/nickel transport system substrate-binding protein